ncbi:hypothetical protein KVT40_005916 [Elsinoe batatas]|uniref:Magnesium-dependent phosphatase-1 n=1 Tax=Elsinoe batatas TaxID=2601811 RepID=A0A8K0PEP3_9PEZI|nr:hypothetical protein KVT40_005916 [Elsinoe batatas]
MPKPITAAVSTSPTTTVPASILPSPACFSDSLPLPKILVFDLDYTLWPLWVDTHVTPPLKPSADGLTVQDRYGEKFGFYKDVAGLLVHAKEKGMMVGAASRTSAPDVAEKALRLLTVPIGSGGGEGEGGGEKEGGKGRGGKGENGPMAWSLFDVLEIYPGDKKTHFERIRKKTGLPFEDMLFFDDERRNKNVEKGVAEWRGRNARTKKEGEGRRGGENAV